MLQSFGQLCTTEMSWAAVFHIPAKYSFLKSAEPGCDNMPERLAELPGTIGMVFDFELFRAHHDSG